ncbi:hypothetical protein V5O48_010050 [Marasmius crinis-equi]|uniref:N-acetyltransferase domain-containing protein n=1 Tax=Marasmius crinis-equi TaxID=585013 RepID=A0ABR3F9C4_9AGAR
MKAQSRNPSILRIRVCRPSDYPALQRLFKICIVYGGTLYNHFYTKRFLTYKGFDRPAGSPCRKSIADGFSNPAIYGIYLLLALSVVVMASGHPHGLLLGAPVCMAIVVYLAILLHGRAELYVKFAYSSCKDDLDKIVEHYNLKVSSYDPAAYVATGPRGFWVAEVDVPGRNEPEIVGCIGLVYGSDHGEMRRMVVSPYHRRMGIAQKLFDVCEAHAHNHKLSSIVLTTTQFQPHARSLYEKYGYFVDSTKLMPSGLLKIRNTLAKVVEHYNVKALDNDPGAIGISPKGLWVAEVNIPGKAEPEIVVCVALDELVDTVELGMQIQLFSMKTLVLYL